MHESLFARAMAIDPSEPDQPVLCLPIGDWLAYSSVVNQYFLRGPGSASGGAESDPESELATLLAQRPCLLLVGLILARRTGFAADGTLESLVAGLYCGPMARQLAGARLASDGEDAVFARRLQKAGRFQYGKAARSSAVQWRGMRRLFRRLLLPVAGLTGKRNRRRWFRQNLSVRLFGEWAELREGTCRSGGQVRRCPLLRGEFPLEHWVRLACNQRQISALQVEFVERLHEEKLASLRQFAYGASHEINNPLANISMRSQALQRGESDPGRLKSLRTIYQQSMRAHQMITDLMLFANPPAPEPKLCDPGQVIAEVLMETAQSWPDRGFRLQLKQWGERGPVYLDPLQLAELTQALVRNAVEALRGPGLIEVAVERRSQGGCTIRFRDDGPGMDATTRRHLFDPFYSGREAGRGLGFGLPKAWTIMQLHGGSLKCLRGDPGWTEFVAEFPEPQAAVCDLPLASQNGTAA